MKFKIIAVALVAGLAACSSNPKKLSAEQLLKEQNLSPQEQRALAAGLYLAGRKELDAADFSAAGRQYEALIKRFPFTDFAIQAQLEKTYALYRTYSPDEALTEAEHFLRDYPRHAHADYVQYLKGLINFERDRGIEAMMGFDVSKRDTTNLRRAFDDFALLIQKYPDSPYVGDARRRMIDVRNRIAEHELTVVDYYMRRGAYVAASRRAEQIVAQYPGSPATLKALSTLEKAYKKLDLDAQAQDAHKLRQAYLAKTEPAPDAPLTSDATPPALTPAS